MMRLGILGSTRGTNLLAIIKAIEEGRLSASIEVVLSNQTQAMILERSKAAGIPAIYCPVNGLNRYAYDEKVSQILQEYRVDLIVLIGYMRILSKEFVHQWSNKIINVHPSLLPAFAGKMDLAVHEAVIASKIKETGCTVHYVTEDVDEGPIILQKKCPVSPEDNPESLKAKVQELEAQALIDSINAICKKNQCD